MESLSSIVPLFGPVSLGIATIYVCWLVCRHTSSPLPPGPSPLPLVGNIFNIPKTSPWVTYRKLSKQYGKSSFCSTCMMYHWVLTIVIRSGKILALRAFGQVLIVVDDAKVAVELLEKRSAVYSSRPESSMVAL